MPALRRTEQSSSASGSLRATSTTTQSSERVIADARTADQRRDLLAARLQSVVDGLSFGQCSDGWSRMPSSRLSERERVRLGAGFEEGDLQRPLADRAVLAHELVQAAFPEQAGPVLVDVDAV